MTDGVAAPRTKVLGTLLSPRTLWAAVSQADLSTRNLLLRYILPFSAIGPIAAAAGAVVLGVEVHGAFFHPPLSAVLIAVVGMWVVNIIIVMLLAQTIKAFAGVFDAQQRFRQALKLATFSSLPGWLAAIVLFASGLWPIVAVANIYGAFLIARGVGPVMGARKECAVIYGTLIIAIFALLLSLGSFAAAAMGRASLIPKLGEVPDGRLVAPGLGSIDLRQAREALRQLHGDPAGETQAPPSSPEELQALLPSDLTGGFSRIEASNETVSLGGFTGSTAEGVYAFNDNRITIKISDAGAAKALIDAVTLKSSRSSTTGYEKRGMVDGRMTVEKYDRPSQTGEYAVVIAGRYIVQAKGRADVGALKAAAQAVSWDRLEAMSRG